jgi:hypothetical protein
MSTKKPSSPVNIGGEKYYKYLIVWNDIVGDSTITDLNDFENMKTAIIKTEAYIFKKTKADIHTFSSYQNDDGEVGFGDRNIIPRSVIQSMIRI